MTEEPRTYVTMAGKSIGKCSSGHKRCDTEYIVLCGQIVGGGGHPFTVEYDFNGTTFTDRQEAIEHGLKVRESDDFNIGVVRDGKLISLDWMDKPIDTDPNILNKIAEQIDL